MLICRTIAQCRAAVAKARLKGETVGLVPTMGFLHDGHLSLVNAARARADWVVVTIFVNPAQFGASGDLETYPRDEARDLALLKTAGVDIVLIPDVAEVYPSGDETIVETTRLANMLHGEVRPGHFRGVTTVVARLFNIVAPDIACFGEKDYQQLQVIRRMTCDLAFPIDIIGCPTVRQADGLAMSSRNVRLTPADRAAAVVISQALDAAQAATRSGIDVATLRDLITTKIATEPRATLCGLDIVGAGDLGPLTGALTQTAAIMISVDFGGILLIDQREVIP